MSENLDFDDEEKFNNILTILNDACSNLPVFSKDVQNSQSFQTFMKEKINKYVLLVEDTIGSSEPRTIERLKESNNKIQDCIEESLFRSQSISWTIFCDFFEIIKEDLKKVSSLCDFLYDLFSETIKEKKSLIKTLYRSRRSRDIFNEIIGPLDLFHIPFEKRFWSKNYRYTKAGYPGLYLGESAYICWAELGYFDLNQLVLASFTFYRGKLKFLDISWRPIEIAKTIDLQTIAILFTNSGKKKFAWCNSYYDNLLSYIVCIPLIMMCSVEISNKNKKRTFMPEYIIPQYLFRYISEFKEAYFQGIKYFSMCRKFGSIEAKKWDDYSLDLLSKNYILVIPDLSHKGHSKDLREKIKISEPISYQSFIVNQNLNIGGISYGWENAGATKIPGLTTSNYGDTIFGKMEFFLHKIESTIFKGKKFLFEGFNIPEEIKIEIFLGIIQNSGKIVLNMDDDPDYIIRKDIEKKYQTQNGKPLYIPLIDFSVILEASIFDKKNLFHK